MNNKEFLIKYIDTPSPSGHEMLLGGQKVWIEGVTPYCDYVETDNYGNAYAYFGKTLHYNPDIDKTVLLDAHCDEIGFFVFDITEDGYIKIGTLGGSDITIAPSSRVNIWVDKDNPVKGVFGHPAIHVHKREFESKLENTFIDIGVSSKDEVLNTGIVIGTPITLSDGYMEMGNYHCGRALDDKIGGYITKKVLENLAEGNIKLPYRLVVVNAVQEEVGLFGAQQAAQLIKPDLAIAIDVSHDTESPAYDKNKQGTLKGGNGAVIMDAPSIHKNVLKALVDCAKRNDIPYQLTANGRESGTNADSYAYPHGIPTGLVKLAMKYMHTTVEMVHKKDVESVIELLTKFLIEYNPETEFKYT